MTQFRLDLVQRATNGETETSLIPTPYSTFPCIQQQLAISVSLEENFWLWGRTVQDSQAKHLLESEDLQSADPEGFNVRNNLA